MYSFFDGNYNYNKLDIIYLALIFALVLAFILYIVISNSINKKYILDKKHSLRKLNNSIRIDFENKKIYLYNNNERKLIAKYTFLEFNSLIEYKSLTNFNEWLNKIKNSKANAKLSTGVYLYDTNDSSKHYIKFNLLSYNPRTKEAFASLEEINRGYVFSDKLQDTQDFYESIKVAVNTNNNDKKGVIIALKITNMEFLRKRYGNENANILLGEMFHRISKLNKENEVYSTYIQNNVFCIFVVGINTQKQAKLYVTDLISELASEPVQILNKHVEPALNVNFSIYGDKTYDIKLAVNLTVKSLEKSAIRFVKNKYVFDNGSIENEDATQSKYIERLNEIITNEEFNISYEPILCTEHLRVLGFIVRSDFNLFNSNDNFITVYNASEKYGLKNAFLYMYYRHLFNEVLAANPKSHQMIVRADVSHLEIIKNIWKENNDYLRIKLIILLDYEEIIHPKKQINFNAIFDEFLSMRIRFALSADENMLTIVSNLVKRVDWIIFDEFMITNIESSDLKQITIDNIINNTHNNKIKFAARGISKYEQVDILSRYDIDNISGSYITEPLKDIHNHDFIKNRHIQLLRSGVEDYE